MRTAFDGTTTPSLQQFRIDAMQDFGYLGPRIKSHLRRLQTGTLIVKPPQRRHSFLRPLFWKIAGLLSETLPRPSLVRQQQWQAAGRRLMSCQAPVLMPAHQHVTARLSEQVDQVLFGAYVRMVFDPTVVNQLAKLFP